jgi:hypothetical protein
MTEIESLHACYTQMTHVEIRIQVWERAFADFLEHGYTCDDLQLVLGHILRENRRMQGAKFSLRLNTLLDFEYMRFDSLLGEAKAIQRNRIMRSPKQAVLEATGRAETKTANTAQHVARLEVIQALRKAAE